jgi:hypothetical protein
VRNELDGRETFRVSPIRSAISFACYFGLTGPILFKAAVPGFIVSNLPCFDHWRGVYVVALIIVTFGLALLAFQLLLKVPSRITISAEGIGAANRVGGSFFVTWVQIEEAKKRTHPFLEFIRLKLNDGQKVNVPASVTDREGLLKAFARHVPVDHPLRVAATGGSRP